jgi:hypothetical protein
MSKTVEIKEQFYTSKKQNTHEVFMWMFLFVLYPESLVKSHLDLEKSECEH